MFLNIARVAALPGTLVGSTMYIVKATEADLAEVYFTNTDGTEVRHVINKSDITNLVNASVAGALTGFSTTRVVADIAAMNAISMTANGLALVLDATADATVTAGAALYVWSVDSASWIKVAEYESLDMTWSKLQGRPVSSPAAIDTAVADSHTHANKASLDKVGEDAEGNIQFGGSYPKVALAVSNW